MRVDNQKKKGRVTFRDQAEKGKDLADIYIVAKISYPEVDPDTDSGKFSCSCSIF